MAGLNKVYLIGNLGQDPEIRYSPKGDAILKISLATTSSFYDKVLGQIKHNTEWHTVKFFGKNAENIKNFVVKGDKIYVEGEIRTEKWKDGNGMDRKATLIYGRTFHLMVKQLGSKTEEESNQTEIDDDEIPF